MSALVVYHSLYGNTASLAHAIADSIGDGARALTTAQATVEVTAAASLLIVGSPVHMARLPSDASMRNARRRPGQAPADDHPTVSAWLAALPRLQMPAAAFDTRSTGALAGRAAPAIARRLRRRGCKRAAAPEHFLVTYSHDGEGLPLTHIAAGEHDRARAWARKVAQAAALSSHEHA